METNLIESDMVVVKGPDAGKKGEVRAAYVGDDGDNRRLRLVVELEDGGIVDAPAYYFRRPTDEDE